MNDYEFWSMKLLKLKYRRRDEIIQNLCKIGSPQKLGLPSLICRNFKTLRKVLLNYAETFKIEIQNRGPNKSDVLNLEYHAECIEILMNDYDFGSMKLLKLKQRRGDQIIQNFCKIGSPQKLGPLSLICRNFNTLRKVLLNHEEWIET